MGTLKTTWARRRLLGTFCSLVLVGDLVALVTISAPSGTAAAPEDSRPFATGPDVAARLSPAAGAGGKLPPTSTEAGRPSATPPTTAPIAPVHQEGWDFAATLEPKCAVVGQTFKLTLVLGNKGMAAMSARYADGEDYGTRSIGEAGPDGTYVYTWKAPAAPGDAFMQIAAGAQGAGGKRDGGTKTIPFRVVGVTERC